jgi:hypothetical protein
VVTLEGRFTVTLSMIVYREQRATLPTADVLADLETISDSRELLIAFGELEAAVADSQPASDPAIAELRRVSLQLGRYFYRGPRPDLRIRATLPAQVEVRVPEGYAYYGLFPDTYVAAAESSLRDLHPHASCVIGIRSIGTSLSAAVAGTLAENGVDVDSFTVRPHGHPYHRTTRLDRSVDPSKFHLIVDEGPGLSGSSFASVARALKDAGVPDDRIFLFPSWRPDPAALLSPEARDCFARHRIYCGAFHPAMIDSDLAAWTDFSAGKWRDFTGVHSAVQPQHERRKFLSPRPPFVLGKFAGFGRRGKHAFDRARALYDAGFTTQPLDLRNGFLFSHFADGQSVTRTSTPLADRIAAYLKLATPLDIPVPWNTLAEMISVNLDELLGIDAAPLLEMRPLIENLPAYQLDGRMMRHEWIATPAGFLKTDAVDHADDHFFPGPQDIAWDIAAAIVEFGLDDSFPSQFGSGIRARVEFYKVAYSVFRLAYCRMAAAAVPEEAAGFCALAAHYEAVTRASPLLRRSSS